MRLVTALLLTPLAGCVILDEESGTPRQPGDPEHLKGAGLSYGECLGYCTHQLVIDGRDLALRHASNTGEPDLDSGGRLTDQGAAAVAELEVDLEAATLVEVYGCPDCNDGGDAYLELLDADDIVARIHWAADDPDPAVAAAHALLIDDLLRGLWRCDATPNLIVGDCTIPE